MKFTFWVRTNGGSCKATIALFVSLISFQQLISDHLSEGSTLNKWTCTCSSAYGDNQNFTDNNCSTSCDCSPGGSANNSWTCICAAENQSTSCFTSCNCSFGSSGEIKSAKKHIFNRSVIIVLSVCFVFTITVLAALILCYIHKEKSHLLQSLPSSDKETSCNSTTKLIINSAAQSRFYIESPINPVLACFQGRRKSVNGPVKQFSYSELVIATNKFCSSNLIAVGGSSHVYIGRLKDGRTVAIKRLRSHGAPDTEAVFSTEIELISRLHHRHLVPLLGYCSENKGTNPERVLVYQYVPNGNLRDSLDGASGICLDWSTRVAIALGAAKGLDYLHEAAAPRILHRDVKSTNILLDEDWRAKITDLGMAKHLIDGVPSCSSSPARMQGTFGYFAPEYAIIGRASFKSDVFSFGVVLLELISGRQAITRSSRGEEESLVIWAGPRLQDSRRVISELADLKLKGDFPEEEMQVMAYLAKECLMLDPDCRPTMSEVVQILTTIAPEKSRRLNLPLNILQNCHNREGEVTKDCINQPIEEIIETDQIKQANRSCRRFSQDDDEVDLTEPRFESFSMESFNIPLSLILNV
ncbi:receptor-like serine/threonine-protein kinase NCRK isoform X2 [Impatiens glandulifera]|uniref:receptor-like serine/threonine-protein kinase NCRK isoform X2 n=1 Tax=Impatiens glandulifera TaxID=253017 RepID=UPI001FB085C5|nr:receptor-like serine/threonine-protein kinase NCRK isoform X2 [Impatiens glandulifera]